MTILDTIKGNLQEARRLQTQSAHLAAEADQVQRHAEALVPALDEAAKGELATWQADFDKRKKA